MIKHIKRILVTLVAYVLVIFLYNAFRGKVVRPEEVGAFNPREFRGVDWFPGHALGKEAKLEYLQRIHTRVEQLKMQESERALRRKAAAKAQERRKEEQRKVRDAWDSIVKTNMPKYRQLLAAARKDPRGEVQCAIGDGFSYMPCILCNDHSGKCTVCDGTGREVSNEYCPACIGTGNCYLCSGTGKMFCPFCDDGMILKNGPAPAKSPPLE